MAFLRHADGARAGRGVNLTAFARRRRHAVHPNAQGGHLERGWRLRKACQPMVACPSRPSFQRAAADQGEFRRPAMKSRKADDKSAKRPTTELHCELTPVRHRERMASCFLSPLQERLVSIQREFGIA